MVYVKMVEIPQPEQAGMRLLSAFLPLEMHLGMPRITSYVVFDGTGAR
jgi:hypothetical protein